MPDIPPGSGHQALDESLCLVSLKEGHAREGGHILSLTLDGEKRLNVMRTCSLITYAAGFPLVICSCSGENYLFSFS